MIKRTSIYLLFLQITLQVFSQEISIDEKQFVTIGGIEQWITIKGDNINNPVILFLHGGPGSTMSQYENNMYGEWEKDFILVNWDQRGAGRTYGRNVPPETTEEYWIDNPLTVEQMSKDGIELTKYLINHLKKKKVILLGTSWGSILGSEMTLSNPELFHAYIGHAQFVKFSDNINYAYTKTHEFTKRANNVEEIQKLESLGKPPYTNAKNYGELLQIVKKYESINSIPAPDTWFRVSAEYDNEKDIRHRYEGDDYSFIHFVGHEKLGIESMVSQIDFNNTALNFDIPVYYIQGEKDILTSKEINKPYFDKINAPKKEYILLPNSAHGYNQSVINKQFEVIKKLEIK